MNKEKKYTDGIGAGPSPHGPVPRMQNVQSNIEKIHESASEELENLLKTHPDLAEVQNEIERLLRNSGAFENRMAVLGLMMEVKLRELQNRISYLFSTE